MISYHFYAKPTQNEPPEVQQYTFFNQADRFLAVVRWAESIRQRLSPQTQTDLDELGSQTGTDGTGMPPELRRSADSEFLLEPLRRDVCLPLRRTGQAGHRGRGRVAAGRLSNAVAFGQHGGLEYRPAQCALLGAEIAPDKFRSRRQAR